MAMNYVVKMQVGRAYNPKADPRGVRAFNTAIKAYEFALRWAVQSHHHAAIEVYRERNPDNDGYVLNPRECDDRERFFQYVERRLNGTHEAPVNVL